MNARQPCDWPHGNRRACCHVSGGRADIAPAQNITDDNFGGKILGKRSLMVNKRVREADENSGISCVNLSPTRKRIRVAGKSAPEKSPSDDGNSPPHQEGQLEKSVNNKPDKSRPETRKSLRRVDVSKGLLDANPPSHEEGEPDKSAFKDSEKAKRQTKPPDERLPKRPAERLQTRPPRRPVERPQRRPDARAETATNEETEKETASSS
ncbi:histone H1E-like [Macrobrachium nipponense]|uniref:histone H1E-like n=1 Tax=Macrobrachium nipponense TaxID=159736 RepID=UPI0030C803F1